MRHLALAALIAAFAGCGGQNTPTSPSPATTPNQAPSPTTRPAPSSTWKTEGVRLDNAGAGVSGVIADTSTLRLNDGRWRMFVFAGGQYRSAVSVDGLSFTMESGARLPEGLGQIRVLRVPDGRVRAYSTASDGIVSSISSDEGMTFTSESGTRVSASAAGFTTGGAAIVRTRDGTWRMYFSDLPLPGEGVKPHTVRSASSSDLLDWTVDAGVRIGPGAALSGSAEHPGAMANPDGSISLFYFRNETLKLMMATSSDGLTFTSESDTNLSQANGPDPIRLPNGMVRLYYNWGNDAAGAIYSALSSGAFALSRPSSKPAQ